MLTSNEQAKRQQRLGLAMIAVYVFLIFAFPRAGIRLGPAPVYFLDVAAAGIVFCGLFTKEIGAKKKNPFTIAVIPLLLLIVLSEFRGVTAGASIIDASYLLIRILLGILVMFYLPKFVREERDLVPLFKSATVAILITSLLMIATSLPVTRGFVTENIFSLSFLEPAADAVTKKFLAEAGLEVGQRGRSLVGVSILSATFINIGFPFIAVLALYRAKLSGIWRKITLIAAVLAPAAVLMSYSRGPLLGFALLLVVALIINRKRFSNSFLVPIVMLIAAVVAVGTSSQIFMFDRLQKRTEAMMNNPLDDERESERLLAYSEPFTHLANNPRFALLGEGNAIRRSGVSAAIDEKSNHALFAAAYYAYGLLAAVIFHVILLQALYLMYREQLKRQKSSFGGIASQAALLSLVAILPWAAFGHAIVSEPRGTMMFFLILGFVVAVARMPASARGKLPAQQPLPRQPVPALASAQSNLNA